MTFAPAFWGLGPRASRALRVLAVVAAVLALLFAAALVFPWDWLREPLNRYVTDQTGRHFEVTRRLEVHPGWTTRVRMDGVKFANPAWARDPWLIQADAAEFDIRLMPLLAGHLELPSLVLRKPRLSMQQEVDGRRSWAFGRDTASAKAVPVIGVLAVDAGELRFLAAEHGADIRTEFDVTASAGDALPLRYKATGRWQGQPFSAQGRTGSVLALNASAGVPFPLEIHARAGRTSLQATGTIASLATLDGVNATFDLRGANLADLYRLIGVVLPETPRYALRGQLGRQGAVWRVDGIKGQLGQSDLGGDLAYDVAGKVPILSGKLQSRVLDFDDLAPLVGLPEQKRSAAALPAVAGVAGAAVEAPSVQKEKVPGTAGGARVLPTAKLDLQRIKAMNANVHFTAASIRHVKELPLDRADLQVRLTDGVLALDPMQLGVAGGGLSGRLRINANSDPADVAARFDVHKLRLNRLLPTVDTTRSSLGRLDGQIDLSGRGNSVASMLGTANGNAAVLMGSGEISNLLLEFMGLDGGEIIKFLLRGDQNVRLRCAAAAFDVRQGLMTSRAIVLDTVDTVIHGSGTVSLTDERLNLVLRPEPKDASILSLRSPLRIGGSFAAPKAGPDKGALAGRAGTALALGLINPLLALAATIETGPGEDADCQQVLARAATPATTPAMTPAAAKKR